MPVSLERLNLPLTDQDVTDINKILKETDAAWQEDLPITALETPTPDAQALLRLLTDQYHLMGGRFNDRLIGLVLIKQHPFSCSQTQLASGNHECETTFEISKVGVRLLTRHRSVASQMLVRLCQLAKVNDWRLSVSKHKLKRAPYLESTLAAQGFYATQEAWVWPSKN